MGQGFLVLQREVDQDVVIIAPDGTEIDVRVIDVISGRKIRQGVRAPREYQVHRREVWDQIKAEKAKAAKAAAALKVG